MAIVWKKRISRDLSIGTASGIQAHLALLAEQVLDGDLDLVEGDVGGSSGGRVYGKSEISRDLWKGREKARLTDRKS